MRWAGRPVQVSEGLQGLVLLQGQRLEVLMGQALFAGAKHLRMAGQDLLG